MSHVSQHQRFLRPQPQPLLEAALAEEFAASGEQRTGEGREQATVLLQLQAAPPTRSDTCLRFLRPFIRQLQQPLGCRSDVTRGTVAAK